MPKLTKSLALPFALALVSCGGDSEGTGLTTGQSAPAPTAKTAGLAPSLGLDRGSEVDDDAPMTIASLVPEGSTIWIRIESTDALIELVDELLVAFGAGADFETFVGMTPFANAMSKVDRTREMGWALSFADSGELSTTLILPALDTGAVSTALRSLPDAPQTLTIDDYVVATTLDEYRPGLGSTELTTGLPEGEISVRIHLAQIMEQKAQEIEMGLNQVAAMSGQGFDAAGQSFSEAIQTAVTSAESIDFAINFEDDEVDLSFRFAATPDSELDNLLPSGVGSLRDLARCLEDDDTMSMMVTVDSATVQEQLMPLWSEAMDRAVSQGELDSGVQALVLEWGALWPLLGDSMVVSVETEGDFQATYFFQPPDHQSFLDGFDAVVRSVPRNFPEIQISGPDAQTSETVYEVSYSGDHASTFESLTDSGSLSLRVASMQNLSVVTIGKDERAMDAALSRIMRASEGIPASLEYVMNRIGTANPAFVARIDMAAFVRDLSANVDGMESLPVDPNQGPVHMTYYGGVNGRFWNFGLRADVAGLSELFGQ